MARIAPLFAGSGLTPMQAGNGAASVNGGAEPKLEPGSVLAVLLLDGDMQLTAVGTCTERIGSRIFGFGHSFDIDELGFKLSEGPIELPVGSGSIAAIVSNVETSFKLGFLSGTSGALVTDETVGVAGLVGKSAPMAPLEFRIIYNDGSVDQTYHFTVALHPKLTPVITAAAAAMALAGQQNLPEYHTVDYDVTEQFADGHTVHVNNSSVNGDGTRNHRRHRPAADGGFGQSVRLRADDRPEGDVSRLRRRPRGGDSFGHGSADQICSRAIRSRRRSRIFLSMRTRRSCRWNSICRGIWPMASIN